METFAVKIGDDKWIFNKDEIKTFKDLKIKVVLTARRGIIITVGGMRVFDEDKLTDDHIRRGIKVELIQSIKYLKHNDKKIYFYCSICRKNGVDENGMIRLSHGNKCRIILSKSNEQSTTISLKILNFEEMSSSSTLEETTKNKVLEPNSIDSSSILDSFNSGGLANISEIKKNDQSTIENQVDSSALGNISDINKINNSEFVDDSIEKHHTKSSNIFYLNLGFDELKSIKQDNEKSEVPEDKESNLCINIQSSKSKIIKKPIEYYRVEHKADPEISKNVLKALRILEKRQKKRLEMESKK